MGTHIYFVAYTKYVLYKENIGKLAILNAVYAPPNQHQINVNAWLPPWQEMDELANHGIRYPGLSMLIMGLMWYTMQQDSHPQAMLKKSAQMA